MRKVDGLSLDEEIELLLGHENVTAAVITDEPVWKEVFNRSDYDTKYDHDWCDTPEKNAGHLDDGMLV